MEPEEANLLQRAIEIAVAAHRDQREEAGAPYLLHPLRMLVKLRRPEEMMAAILHDVVEDSEWTLDQLRAEGFPEKVIQAVDSLTRRSDETYGQFIERILKDPLASRVKLQDLEDNLNLLRRQNVDGQTVEKLQRYLSAWREIIRHTTA
jgi:hypothetical protein